MRLTPFFFIAMTVLFVLSSHSNAFAQSVAAPSSFDQFMEKVTGAGKQTVGFSTNGTPTISPGVPTITPDGGLPRVDASGGVRNPSGNHLPTTARGRIPGAAAAKAIGNFAKKVLPGVAWAIAIKELADELGFKLDKNPDGTAKYERTVGAGYTTDCSTSPPLTAATLVELANVCAANRQAYWQSQPGQSGCTATAELGTDLDRFKVIYGGTCSGNPTYMVSSSEGVVQPATEQEFIDAIASKSGWPSGSAIGRAIVATGEKVDPGPLTVTGPATSPGTSSQTQKPNGNTETKTVTHNHTYNGNTITTTTTTVINNYNPTTNTTETETTTETPEPEPEPDNTVVDTALPDQPKLYEPKYPQGLTGVWAQKKAELVATPLASLVTQLMPSVGSGGTCPAWNLSLNLGAWDYGSHNVAPPCYIWDWCKFFIIAGALLLARALIFGG